jgi:hypothetical protein
VAEQPRAAAHVQERLVQAERLDQRGEGVEDIPDPAADRGVVFHPHRQEGAVRAQPAGGGIGMALWTPKVRAS